LAPPHPRPCRPKVLHYPRQPLFSKFYHHKGGRIYEVLKEDMKYYMSFSSLLPKGRGRKISEDEEEFGILR
jgi:hypothetical protein